MLAADGLSDAVIEAGSLSTKTVNDVAGAVAGATRDGSVTVAQGVDGDIVLNVAGTATEDDVVRSKAAAKDVLATDDASQIPVRVRRLEVQSDMHNADCYVQVEGGITNNGLVHRCTVLTGGGEDFLGPTVAGGITACTAGFPAGPATTYAPYLMTAGHCNAWTGNSWWQSCTYTGVAAWTCGLSGIRRYDYYGNPSFTGDLQGDGEVLEIDDTATWGTGVHGWWDWAAASLGLPANGTVPYYYPYNPSDAAIGNAPGSTGSGGTVACVEGHWSLVVSGSERCGTINYNNVSTTVTDYNALPPGPVSNTHKLQIDGMCTIQGDSGGPIFGPFQGVWVAIGIVSTSNDDPNLLQCAPSPTTWAEPVGRLSYVTGMVPYGF